jgi:hypothetical protein
LESGFDVISFASIENDWFQSVPAAVFDDLDRLCQDFRYEKRVALGSSMGGFAAICFSRALKCDVVLAYSPQFKITEWFDGRFEEAGKAIKWNYVISKQTIEPSCRYHFVFDSKDHDRVHVAALKSLIDPSNVSEIAIPYAGHASVFYLLEVGLLKHVTLNALRERPVDPKDLRRDKRRSRQYLTTLRDHLRRRGHSRIACNVDQLIGGRYEPSRRVRWLLDKKIPLLSHAAIRLERWRLVRLRFDEDFYRHIHFDVALSGLDPASHYVVAGHREGRLAKFDDISQA